MQFLILNQPQANVANEQSGPIAAQAGGPRIHLTAEASFEGHMAFGDNGAQFTELPEFLTQTDEELCLHVEGEAFEEDTESIDPNVFSALFEIQRVAVQVESVQKTETQESLVNFEQRKISSDIPSDTSHMLLEVRFPMPALDAIRTVQPEGEAAFDGDKLPATESRPASALGTIESKIAFLSAPLNTASDASETKTEHASFTSSQMPADMDPGRIAELKTVPDLSVQLDAKDAQHVSLETNLSRVVMTSKPSEGVRQNDGNTLPENPEAALLPKVNALGGRVVLSKFVSDAESRIGLGDEVEGAQKIDRSVPLDSQDEVDQTSKAPQILTEKSSLKHVLNVGQETEASVKSESYTEMLDGPHEIPSKSQNALTDPITEDVILGPGTVPPDNSQESFFAIAQSKSDAEVPAHYAAFDFLSEVPDVVSTSDQRVSTSGPELPARLAAQLADVARHLPDGPVEISLSPEELGKVKLTFQLSESGAMNVVVAVERPETLELMRRNVDSLLADFSDLGYENSSFQFHQDDQQNGREGEKQADDRAVNDLQNATGPPPLADTGGAKKTTKLNLSAISGMDLRL